MEGRYHDTKSSRECTEKLMMLPDRPTAIVYPDDVAYIGGSVQLEKMNLSVPQDVSAVGYDGVNLSQIIRPRLTTYYQDAEAIGRESARKLVETIENKKAAVAEEIKVSGRLLEGGTVRQIG